MNKDADIGRIGENIITNGFLARGFVHPKCTLDPLLLGEPMQEIIRNASRDGITEEAILGHAALHGAEVVENVRAALAIAV